VSIRVDCGQTGGVAERTGGADDRTGGADEGTGGADDQVLGGRYHLRERLGRGGTAVVWRAHDAVLGRAVAVKVLAGPLARDPGWRRRIHDEARSAATLSHPNIAQIHDFGESGFGVTDVVPYVVMELVHGHTLAQHMTGGRLPPLLSMRICGEVASALSEAHAHGIVHRDIKPGNVMVTPNGAKVVDFGLAAAVDPGGAGELDDRVDGTPAYLAPERLTGDSVEPASDVYALGVVLYMLLAGHAPWDADSTTRIFYSHVHVQPHPLPPMPDVPDRVIELCNRSLHKVPSLRPSAREMADLLTRAAGGPGQRPWVLPTPALPPVTPEKVPEEAPAAVVAPVVASWAPPSRRRVLIAAAAVIVLAVGATTWFLVPSGPRYPGAALADPVPTDPVPTDPVPTAVPTPSGVPALPIGTPSGGPLPSITSVAPDPSRSAATDRPDRPRPTSARPTASRPPGRPPASSVPEGVGFSSRAGSVVATCATPITAQLVSWTAKKPFTVAEVDPGPGLAAVVVFAHGDERLRMSVGCFLDVPSASIFPF
jgi:serine/threonine protein kinase